MREYGKSSNATTCRRSSRCASPRRARGRGRVVDLVYALASRMHGFTTFMLHALKKANHLRIERIHFDTAINDLLTGFRLPTHTRRLEDRLHDLYSRKTVAYIAGVRRFLRSQQTPVADQLLHRNPLSRLPRGGRRCTRKTSACRPHAAIEFKQQENDEHLVSIDKDVLPFCKLGARTRTTSNLSSCCCATN